MPLLMLALFVNPFSLLVFRRFGFLIAARFRTIFFGRLIAAIDLIAEEVFFLRGL